MAWFNVYWIGALVTAYLLGSIPTAYLAGRIGKGTDIRQEGDRNPGAGNVYRVLGPKVGLLVAVVDIGKGALAVAVAKMVMGNMAGEMAAGTLAVAGHNWPIFLQLRGGRGAASTVGVLLVMLPGASIPLAVAALLLLPIVRSATVCLSLMMIPLPFVALLAGVPMPLVAYSAGLPVMAGIRHYFSSRALPRGEKGHAEGQPLPHG